MLFALKVLCTPFTGFLANRTICLRDFFRKFAEMPINLVLKRKERRLNELKCDHIYPVHDHHDGPGSQYGVLSSIIP
jgi:hypothetical protein